MSIDLRTIVRRRRPERRRTQLRPRPADAVESWTSLRGEGRVTLVPDTCVYIDQANNRMPAELNDLLDGALLFHCSVALAELAQGVGNADPAHPRWPATRDHYAALFAALPPGRVLIPDATVSADAALVAGVLARTQGWQPAQRRQCLNDALILLTAAKAGLAVLTANRDEFDLLGQMAPEGRFVGY